MVIARGLRLTGIGLGAGLVTGLALAFAVKRILAKVLFGVSTTDPATFVLVSACSLWWRCWPVTSQPGAQPKWIR